MFLINGQDVKRAALGLGVATTVFLGYASLGEASPSQDIGAKNFNTIPVTQQADINNNMASGVSVDAPGRYDENFFESDEYKNAIKGVQYTDRDLRAAPYLKHWQGYMPIPTFKSGRAIDYGDGFTDASVSPFDKSERFFKEKIDLKQKFMTNIWRMDSIADLNQDVIHNKSAISINAEILRQKAWINGGQAPDYLKYNESHNQFDLKLTHFTAHKDFRDYKPLCLNESEYLQFKEVFPEGLTMRNMKMVPFFAQHERGFNGYTLKELPNITEKEFNDIRRLNPRAFKGNDEISVVLRTQFSSSLENSNGIQGYKQMSSMSMDGSSLKVDDGMLRGQNMEGFMKTSGNTAAYEYMQQQGQVEINDASSVNKLGYELDGTAKLTEENAAFINDWIRQDKAREQKEQAESRNTDAVEVIDSQYVDYGDGKGSEMFSYNIKADTPEQATGLAKEAAETRLDIAGRFEHGKSAVGLIGTPELKDGIYKVNIEARDVLPEKMIDKELIPEKVQLPDCHKFEPFPVKEISDKADRLVESAKLLADAKNMSIKMENHRQTFDQSQEDFFSKVSKRFAMVFNTLSPDSNNRLSDKFAGTSLEVFKTVEAAGKDFDKNFSDFSSSVNESRIDDNTVMTSFSRFMSNIESFREIVKEGFMDSIEAAKENLDRFRKDFGETLSDYGKTCDAVVITAQRTNRDLAIKMSGTVLKPDMRPEAYFRTSAKGFMEGEAKGDLEEAKKLARTELVDKFGPATATRVLNACDSSFITKDSMQTVKGIQAKLDEKANAESKKFTRLTQIERPDAKLEKPYTRLTQINGNEGR